jgi:hypothetical protein
VAGGARPVARASRRRDLDGVRRDRCGDRVARGRSEGAGTRCPRAAAGCGPGERRVPQRHSRRTAARSAVLLRPRGRGVRRDTTVGGPRWTFHGSV